MKFCPQCASPLVNRTDKKESRKSRCPSKDCNFEFWNNPVPVVAAVVIHEEKIILAQNAQWPAGLYSMITGYLDEYEAPEQAVVREVKEELNLDVQDVSFIGHYMYTQKNQLIIAWAVKAVGALRLNEELRDVRYLSKEELMRYDFQGLDITQAVVRDWSGEPH